MCMCVFVLVYKYPVRSEDESGATDFVVTEAVMEEVGVWVVDVVECDCSCGVCRSFLQEP